METSFQLYSSRGVPSQMKFLSTLAGLGYTQVEGFGGVYRNAPALRGALDAAGLVMPSGHFGLDALETGFEGCLATAEILGITHIYAPYLDADQRPEHGPGYAALARRLAGLARRLGDAGVRFGWHNHDFELRPLADGSLPLDILLTEAPEIGWEADLAWVIRGGADPADVIRRFGDRITAVHVKDIAPHGQNKAEDGWADLGDGIVDWAGLLAQCWAVAPSALMIMEHDKPSDPARFAARSMAAFQALSGGL